MKSRSEVGGAASSTAQMSKDRANELRGSHVM
jgi:hypothetical protein